MTDKIAVKVRCMRPEGRYRAGLYWPGDWTRAVIAAEDLPKLQADSMLAVEIIRTKEDAAAAASIPKSKDVQPRPAKKGVLEVVPWVKEGEEPTPKQRRLQKAQEALVAEASKYAKATEDSDREQAREIEAALQERLAQRELSRRDQSA